MEDRDMPLGEIVPNTVAGENEPLPAPPAAAPMVERPADVPEEFWDKAAGTIRIEDVLRELLALRAATAASDEAHGQMAAGLDLPSSAPEPPGPPPNPEDYVIAPPHAFIESDPALNAKLHAAGFTQAQAQLVYELAAERLVPMVGEVISEVEARRHLDRLERHFGGEDAWRQTAAQLKSWGTAHLAPEVMTALAGSFEGILALQQMMRASEPTLLDTGMAPAAEPDEATLAEMMRDPRYWQQRDPEFVARVTAGFRKLYGG